MVAYLERDLLQCRLQVCLSLLKEVEGVFFTDDSSFLLPATLS